MKTNIPASVRFIHLRPEELTNSRGGATLAYVGDTNSDGNKVTKIAVAFCNPADNYSKKLGRVKSYGRLQQLNVGSTQPDDSRYFVVEGDDPRAAAEDVAHELALDHGYVRAHERVEWTNQPIGSAVIL